MAKDKQQTAAAVMLNVNGKQYGVDVVPETPLLWVFR